MPTLIRPRQLLQGFTGPSGPTGPSGGPTGPAGIIGPTGSASTVAGPTGPEGVQTRSVAMTFGDGAVVIPVGTQYTFSIPVPHTLLRWRVLAYGFTTGSTGSIVFDVWRDTFVNYPPTVADSVATSKPTLVAGTKAEDATITDWSEVGSAGDVYVVNVDSCALCTLVNMELWYGV